ncbi:hypothetical protein WJX84_004125 [Apatococcus fuscideae]|uniref:RING-type E3 ubiquitin transferase n=1 Tax=Apatococcus fuscideae TaxID=2026836 RepID=A0AAW1T3B2_9CHLO
MEVDLDVLEAETRCPVCLGVIRDARLVSVCMHRFCAECIEKWLRNAKENSCPQCREPMQSRRDCKRDVRFDRLLSVLYGNVERYEEKMEKAASLEVAAAQGAAIKHAAELRRQARAGRSTLLGLPPRPRFAAGTEEMPAPRVVHQSHQTPQQPLHPFATVTALEPMQVAPVWQSAHRPHHVQPCSRAGLQPYIQAGRGLVAASSGGLPSAGDAPLQPAQKRQRCMPQGSPVPPVMLPGVSSEGRSSPSPGRAAASAPSSRQPSPSPVFVIHPEGDAIKEAELVARRCRDAARAEAQSSSGYVHVHLLAVEGSHPLPPDWTYLNCPSSFTFQKVQQALEVRARQDSTMSCSSFRVNLQVSPATVGSSDIPSQPSSQKKYTMPLGELLAKAAPDADGCFIIHCSIQRQESK